METEAPIFRPDIGEFVNFRKYIQKLESLKCSYAKIIPPIEWQPNSKNLDKEFILQTVVKQSAEELLGGAFNLLTEHSQMNYGGFEEAAKAKEMELGLPGMSIDEMENAHWLHICSPRDYSIDNNISLFGNVQIWNLDRLTKTESNIHSTQTHHTLDNVMEGIQSPYVYIGGPLTSFAFHLEDGGLYSANYLHQGAPKIWYCVPAEENKKLEKLAGKLAKNIDCDFFLRHKTMMIPPSILRENKIKFHRIVQLPGEFMIILSGGYHAGFNCGFNIAEAVNFGSNKWLDTFEDFSTCNCVLSNTYDSPKKTLEGLSKIVEKIRQSQFICEECGSKFSEKKNLNLHKRNQHAKFLPCYICPQNDCFSKFNAPYALRTHLLEKHQIGLDLKSVEEFNHPIRNTKKVKEVKAKKRANPIIRKGKTCLNCGRSYTRIFNYNRHLPCTGRNRMKIEKETSEQLTQDENQIAIQTVEQINDLSGKFITVETIEFISAESEQQFDTGDDLRQEVTIFTPEEPKFPPAERSKDMHTLTQDASAMETVEQSKNVEKKKSPQKKLKHVEAQTQHQDYLVISSMDVDGFTLHSNQHDRSTSPIFNELAHSQKFLENSSILPLSTQSDPSFSDEPLRSGEKLRTAQKRRRTKPVEPMPVIKTAKLIPAPSISAEIVPKMKFRIPKIQGTKVKPMEQTFSGSLSMNALVAHCIPENFFDIEANNNDNKFNVFKESVQEKRTDEHQYVNAFKGMLYMNETVESKHLSQFKLTNVKILQHSRPNRMVKVEYDETMPNYGKAVNESTIDTLSIIPVGMENSTIDGRILKCDQNYIYIKITGGFEELSIMNKNSMQFFDLNFHINQTPYQLQLQALDFLVEHQLFKVLINNPLYSTIVEEDSMHTQNQLSCTYGDELNDEQKNAIKNIAAAYCRPVPYLLFGPAGTGKTKTLVSAIEHIVRTTRGHILVCAFSNSACDEIAERLLGVLSSSEVLRMYAKSFKKESLNANCEKISNLKDGDFRFPPLDFIYKFRVVVCTLLTSGCLVRANGVEAKFDAKHFSHIIIDECAFTHEPVSLIPIAGLCTEGNGQIHSCIVLAGDPMQLTAVTKSEYAKHLGFSTSFMEQLFKQPLYQPNPKTKKYNAKYITQLVKNYRSHPDILKVPNELFYENRLEAQFKDEIMTTDKSDLLLNGNSRVIFNAVEGECQQSDTKSSFNAEEAKLVVRYVEEIQVKLKINGQKLQQADIGIVSPYNEQCRNIRARLSAKGYNEITVGSAETYQGQERKVIIVSTVRTGDNLGFVSDGKRFNVMMTRPESLLIIIGDHQALYSNSFWKRLIDHCQNLGSLIKNGRKLNARISAP